MGGGGGSWRSGKEIKELLESAKAEIRKAQEKKNVFISFDHDDLDEVNLLRGHAKNEMSKIEFNDWSVRDPFDSDKDDYIKRKITERISQSSVTVVYLSDKTINSKWVKWEIQKSLDLRKEVLGVYSGAKPAKLPEIFDKKRLKVVAWKDLAVTLDNLKTGDR